MTEWMKSDNGMRRGVTTGACAAAAAKAAAMMLFSGTAIDTVEIRLPAGPSIWVAIEHADILPDSVTCSVQKDAGDDPDVTDGLEIFARAERSDEPGIMLDGGIGVGRVTRPGLGLAVGEAAINPVPRKMILEAVAAELSPHQGVKITIFVPDGAERAARTMNRELGITGGISILGTTGIVEPMSHEAVKKSLALKIDMLAAAGVSRAILVPGRYGQTFAVDQFGLDAERIALMSNHVGFMLDTCRTRGMKEILLIGEIGKMIKVAAGSFDTHSRNADGRMEALAAYGARFGMSQHDVTAVLDCSTTEAALDIIERSKLEGFYPYIAERAARRCAVRLRQECAVGIVLFSRIRGLLAVDEAACRMLAQEGMVQ